MFGRSNQAEQDSTVLQRALRYSHRHLAGVGVFSLFVNVLTLTTSLYMMQLYDRVLASRSVDTLLYLSLIVALALGFQGVLDGVRTVVMSRTSAWLEQAVGPETFERGLEAQLRGSRYTMEGLRDLSTWRNFLGSPAMMSVYDIPWVPLYLGLCFMFHPLIGWIALCGSALLFGVTLLNNALTAKYLKRANADSMSLSRHTEAVSRNAEVIDSMGMASAVRRRWEEQGARVAADQLKASDTTGVVLALSKFVRVAIQVACLGVGAFLALQNEITGGAMVASSIIMGRALQPVEQMIGTWRQVVSARQSYQRLNAHLSQPRLRPAGIPLPEPKGRLAVDRLNYTFPGSRVSMIKSVSFSLEPGESLALLGPSAAGKTTLVRLVIGALEPTVGSVRLDGASMFGWPREDLGRHLGYLPQDVELFDGSVFTNIARLDNADPNDVIAAAQLAGCHEMILKLPAGYKTEIGEGGAMLSGGQRQLIGLARALFGKPKFIVLDEPNANMDTDGEQSLIRALEQLKAMRSTVILITHRPAIVHAVDKVMVLRDGAIDVLGPRDDVLKRLIKPVMQTPAAAAAAAADNSNAFVGRLGQGVS
ncbi:type I secretion system permease/ATPase [Reyranella sp. CPCC 100927]|uniref:type I secretion system permease/ATPase n=1 Tax=Reyranella sp. CPCC 100927 TaxID=2599616 RepID=UPI0011B3B095|nr:type I secretion system permease/ATPase [Reyranella sp. CPCC 100927]TWT01668.1 type I secretion system permease/ATPase [Reyranella sp. CPCC 100927]